MIQFWPDIHSATAGNPFHSYNFDHYTQLGLE